MTPRRSRTRCKVLAFTVALAGITYLDRVCLMMTKKDIMRDLDLTGLEMGMVFAAFTLAYGLFEIPNGAWGQRVGTRKVLTRLVTWWSTFTAATSLAFSFPVLLCVRFLFGMGEAGTWSNVARTFSRWFPARERGTAQGVFFTGAHLVSALTPMLVVGMLTVVSWRLIFVIFGMIGFGWAWAWYRWFRDEPAEHAGVDVEELRWIESGGAPAGRHDRPGVPWRRIVANRSILALCAMYLTQGYGFYFCITWLPSYLEDERGFSGLALGFFAGLPQYACVASDVFGGLSTDYLSRRFGLRIGRATVGGGSLLLASVLLIAGAAVQDPVLAAVLIAVSTAATTFLLGAAWGAIVDIGGNHAGVVSACMNTAGQVGGAAGAVILPLLVDEFSSWSTPLYVIGVLYFLGALCWIVVDPRRSIDAAEQPGGKLAPPPAPRIVDAEGIE